MGRGNPRKGSPDLSVSAQNEQGGHLTTGENTRDYLRLRFQSWVDWFMVLVLTSGKKLHFSMPAVFL